VKVDLFFEIPFENGHFFSVKGPRPMKSNSQDQIGFGPVAAFSYLFVNRVRFSPILLLTE
jgi:hypothetical protein